jgi:sugar/nucleoside kinase (ribokinase family)
MLVDVSKTIDRWPPEQEVALIMDEAPQCGGPGLNMALDLARLGAGFPIAVIGAIGNDSYGELIGRTCEAHGIDCSHLRILADVPSSYTDVMVVKETGRRTFFHAQAANGHLALADFDFAASDAKIFHIGSPGLHRLLDAPGVDGETGFLTLLKRARASGLKTNLELVSLPKDQIATMAAPLLPHLSSIIINDHEAEALTGIAITHEGVTDADAAITAARDLIARGVGEVAVIHFPFGAVAAAPGGLVWRKPSVVVPQDAVVSANGAGDAFAAGVMLGLHEEWPMEECLVLGHASAAASLRAASTFEGVMGWKDCLALAERWGWRQA